MNLWNDSDLGIMAEETANFETFLSRFARN